VQLARFAWTRLWRGGWNRPYPLPLEPADCELRGSQHMKHSPPIDIARSSAAVCGRLSPCRRRRSPRPPVARGNPGNHTGPPYARGICPLPMPPLPLSPPPLPAPLARMISNTFIRLRLMHSLRSCLYSSGWVL
jgi:hypothetical protein